MRDSRSNLFEDALFAPGIQDYQMICKIGGGSYGQVWMALSVTGAYRAVKIVAREDFRLEKTFEREFEGIKKFEPISRSHEGLVDILHVGRSYEENFYYYVMELADDRHANPGTIDPYQYEPRTLRSDIAPGTPIEILTCAKVGAELADALHHLHARGLSHRDVKPSNVIFVDGRPKLADIGLVAETGQQTFVGTEGFVPPEGPGTPQADIYSLGMVLYELATGKDRLDFPELPDNFTQAHSDRDSWHQLNQIMCQCCAPDRRKRYATSIEVRNALIAIANKPRSSWKTRKVPWLIGGGLVAALALAGIASLKKIGGPISPPLGKQEERPTPPAQVTQEQTKDTGSKVPQQELDLRLLESNAAEAIAYTVYGQEIGTLPLQMQIVKQRQVDEFVIDARGYQSSKTVTRDLTSKNPYVPLEKSRTLHRGWENNHGMVFRYDPVKPRHITKWPVGKQVFEKFLITQEGKPPAVRTVKAHSMFPGFDGLDSDLVLTDTNSAQAFCEWLTAEDSDTERYQPVCENVFAGPSHASSLKLLYCQIPFPK